MWALAFIRAHACKHAISFWQTLSISVRMNGLIYKLLVQYILVDLYAVKTTACFLRLADLGVPRFPLFARMSRLIVRLMDQNGRVKGCSLAAATEHNAGTESIQRQIHFYLISALRGSDSAGFSARLGIWSLDTITAAIMRA